MFLIVLLSSLAHSETHAEVREILLGNWSVIRECPSEVDFLEIPLSFHLRVSPTSTESKIDLISYANANSTIPLFNLTAEFASSSKGRFGLLEGSRMIAHFDFSPVLPPHVSSFGDWNDSFMFNALIVTNHLMQLTIFEKGEHDWTVFNFDKQNEIVPIRFWEKYFQIIVMVIVFIGCYAVTILVQKWQLAKRRREVEKLLEKKTD
jgi:hypothetical protein